MLRPDRGTALVFAVSGVVQSSWMSRLPAVQDRLHLGVDDLGLALGAVGVGTIIGMLVTGHLSARVGSGRVILGAAAAAAALLIGIGVAPTFAVLVGVAVAFGAAVGAWDAAMNIRGAAVSQEYGGHVMARLHAFWSVGTVVGAGSGALAARSTLPVGAHFALVAGCAVVLAWLGAWGPAHRTTPGGRKPVRLSRRLVMLGSLILAGAFIEGAASDWLAVLLADDRGYTHAGAAAAYAVFVCAMTVGRFGAGRLYRIMAPDRLVRGGALVTALGVVAAVLGPAAVVVYAGAVLWGVGICFVFPAVLAAGGSEPGADQVVAALTTIGYGASVIGPVALGAVAGQLRLGPSLLILPVLAIAMAWLAPSVRPRA